MALHAAELPLPGSGAGMVHQSTAQQRPEHQREQDDHQRPADELASVHCHPSISAMTIPSVGRETSK